MAGTEKLSLKMILDERSKGKMVTASDSHSEKIDNMALALPATRPWLLKFLKAHLKMRE